MNDAFDPKPGTKRTAMTRCAIYTRKSTDEGLDRDFNSLDAQREAAEAYIKSQLHLGWTLVPHRYDDGGFSGATLDRPALKKLLEDVEAHRVDCIIVYKVDRLSRSLLDFARLVDQFDQRSVSFVSVTQQFNTTSSLGRLTLNILLSFAQFEREIISERTRDKMSAARRKGKWVGGTPVLGFDVGPAGRRLVVNEKEAQRVRAIFELYPKHRSLARLVDELQRRKWKTKSWTSKGGVHHAGKVFTQASLRRLLTNAVYAGKVEHRGTIYAGEHVAIVDPSTWDKVNAKLRANHGQPRANYTKQDPLLADLLVCTSCQRPMVATYTSKKGRRYRYYVCRAVRQNGWDACPTQSVPAQVIEDSVVAQLRIALADEGAREQWPISETELQKLRDGGSSVLVGTLVKQIGYDGTTGAVSLTLRKIEDAD